MSVAVPRSAGKRHSARELLPAISKKRLALFAHYSRGFIRRHFNAVRLLETHPLPSELDDFPVAVFLNHASWWDPLIGLYLANTFFPARAGFAPIDAQALTRYRFLTKCGFFPVEPESTRSAAEFLSTSSAILSSPSRMLWLTPQARFFDVRMRPLHFQPGLAHLAARANDTLFLPLALEYTFWEERLPEVLLGWGEPVPSERAVEFGGSTERTAIFEHALQNVQDAVAGAAQRRLVGEWQVLLRGRAGTNLFYDGWRRLRARFRNESFNPAHSKL